MTPNEIRTTLLSQNQRVARITQGWTVVSCSPDNELTAKAGAAPDPWSRYALVQALHGMQSVDGAFRRRLKRSHRSDKQPALKSRELELIHLLARGHNGPQIALVQRGDRTTPPMIRPG